VSPDKIFVISLFLISIFLTGALLILEKKETTINNGKAAMLVKDISQPSIKEHPVFFETSKTKTGGDIWIRPDTAPFFKPWRDWNVEEPQIEAKSAILMEVKLENDSTNPPLIKQERILFQKNIEEPLPIASLTKIMSALIVLENMDLQNSIKISKEAVNQEGEAGELVVGEEILVKNLLYAMLLESSNDAAFALSLALGYDNFIDLMNKKANSLQLKNTYFSNPTGFDNPQNFSTSYDLARLLTYSLKNQFLWQILKTRVFEARDISGKIFHHWKNTNKLLEEVPRIIGGKTGWTMKAGGCVALAIDNPKNNSRIFSVLLGSPDENKRFEETKKLIDWVLSAYQW